MNKKEKLKKLFNEIYKLNVCGKDPLKVPRDISKTNINSKVMIVAEAMAPKQVRLSGVNYFFKNGEVGNTGKNLEKFLNLFNYTVYPKKTNCVYHTEIVHNFPGYITLKNKRTIRRPSKKEIEDSLKNQILQKEIEVLKPKLILLMGNTAYTSFYKYFLNIKIEKTLTKEIGDIVKNKKYHKYQNIPVIPIQHSSGANPRFNQMLKDKNLVGLIKSVLNEKSLDFERIAQALEKSWGKDTAHKSVEKQWSKENKALGQCAITAVLLSKYFGGDIYKGEVTGNEFSHFWNVLPNGNIVDLTKSQFKTEGVKITKVKVKKAQELLKNKEFKVRYELLEKRVKEYLIN